MATPLKRGVDNQPKKGPEKSKSSEPSCWDWCANICGKQSSSTIDDEPGKGKQVADTATIVLDEKQKGYLQNYDYMNGGQYAGANAKVKTKGSYGQTSDQLYQKLENRDGSPLVGDKKMGSKQLETLDRSDQDAKMRTGSSLIPGPAPQYKQEYSYGSSTEKFNGSPGVEEGKMGSKQVNISGRSDQDAKTKTVSSLIPGPSLQEYTYGSSAEKFNGSPGVGDRKMGSPQPQTLGSSDRSAQTKTGSSLKPGESLQNNQEHRYRSTEKFTGSPGVGDRNMGSIQLQTSGSAPQDAETKTGSSLKPGESLQNNQDHRYGISIEKFNGSPGVGEGKMGSTQPQTLSSFAQDAKTKTGNSLKQGESLQNKQEHRYGISTDKFNGSPGVGDKKMGFTQPETLGSSAQDARTTTSSSPKPGQQLQCKQGNNIPEQLLHKSSLKGDFRQEDINKNGKDIKAQKVTNSAFNHSSEEKRKASPKPENNIASQTKKFNGISEQASLRPRNEQQNDMVKPPSFNNKDNINVDTSSPNSSKSRIGCTSTEQQKGAPKQENNSADPTDTRPRSPMITNFHKEGINKDAKNEGQNYIEATRSSIGQTSKEQPKVTQKQDDSYGSHISTDPIKNTVSGSGQQANIPLSNRQKGTREQEDMNTKDKFGFSNSFVQRD